MEAQAQRARGAGRHVLDRLLPERFDGIGNLSFQTRRHLDRIQRRAIALFNIISTLNECANSALFNLIAVWLHGQQQIAPFRVI